MVLANWWILRVDEVREVTPLPLITEFLSLPRPINDERLNLWLSCEGLCELHLVSTLRKVSYLICSTLIEDVQNLLYEILYSNMKGLSLVKLWKSDVVGAVLRATALTSSLLSPTPCLPVRPPVQLSLPPPQALIFLPAWWRCRVKMRIQMLCLIETWVAILLRCSRRNGERWTIERSFQRSWGGARRLLMMVWPAASTSLTCPSFSARLNWRPTSVPLAPSQMRRCDCHNERKKFLCSCILGYPLGNLSKTT